MKIQKLPIDNQKAFSIDRKMLAKVGDSFYFHPEVSGIKIQIKFKDKTKLEYLRHHVIDEIENNLEEQAENSEAEDEDE